jgi:hypothetical protein
MYKDNADAADPLFFNSQREALCTWHLDDPVDEAERQRSMAIAQHQDGKENPFVLDCTAALRAWCPEYEGCETSSIRNIDRQYVSMIARGVDGQIALRFPSSENTHVSVTVVDMTGKACASNEIFVTDNRSEYSLGNDLPSGLYTVTGTVLSSKRPLSPARCFVH